TLRACRAFHQVKAHDYLCPVRRNADDRPRIWQAAPRSGLRFGLSSARGRLAQAYLAVGAVLFCSRDPERGGLAHTVNRLLGELQIVRRDAANLPVRGLAGPAAQ